jgi:hypothetical protein
MSKVYFKFTVPTHVETGNNSNLLSKLFERIITRIIPKANPDYDHLISEVEIWAIEYDTDDNSVWREIGYDKNGIAIVAMPDNKNYGFWLDTQLTLKDYEAFDLKQLSFTEFESDWTKFRKK